MLTCHPPFALASVLAFPEMTFLAALHALSPSVCEVAPMRFTPDDGFYDDDDTADLSDCAVVLLTRAGSWSARKSKNGSVPASMLALFSSDPGRAAEELCKRGIWRRGKRGGYQFTDWERWGETAEETERRKAEAEHRKEQGRARSQRKRDREKAAKGEAIADGVTRYVTRYADEPAENPQASDAGVTHSGTPASRAPECGVTQPNGPLQEKPQVSGSRVTRYEAGSSRVTAKIDTSDNQDLDPDQSQSVGVEVINAGAREAPPPAIVAFLVAGLSKKLKRVVTEAEACRAAAEWDRRADAAGEVIHDPRKYYPTCIRRETDLEAIIAAPLPAPRPEWMAPAPVSGPGVHAFVPDANPFVDACAHPGCGVKEKNARHVKQEAGTG